MLHLLLEPRKRVIVYDESNFRLGVPATMPIPPLIARALTLCSGMNPRVHKLKEQYTDVPNGHLLTVYSGVIPKMALLICDKLGQELCKLDLSDDISGGSNV